MRHSQPRWATNLRSLGLLLCFLVPAYAFASNTDGAEPTLAADAQMDNAADNVMNNLMQGAFGGYPMSRDASGTSWAPDDTPLDAIHTMGDSWMTMLHGRLSLAQTEQSGPRGSTQSFSSSMLMLAVKKATENSSLGLRAMLSLDPLNGAAGYPLLFQNGETADGTTPLLDRQHPHNLIMELSSSYTGTLSSQHSIFIYGGPVGEPALGPPAFMHRRSSDDNPEAPISHHWIDATHIAFGVVTIGTVWNDWKLESSVFNGREPNQHRYTIQTREFDSWSARISWNPSGNIALQVSTGRLASPEQLEPSVRVQRTTASAMANYTLSGVRIDSTAVWGRNMPSSGVTTDAYLIDMAAHFDRWHTIFGRYEHVTKPDLLPLAATADAPEPIVTKISIGYVFELPPSHHLQYGLGLAASLESIPPAWTGAYGKDPHSVTIFARARLVP